MSAVLQLSWLSRGSLSSKPQGSPGISSAQRASMMPHSSTCSVAWPLPRPAQNASRRCSPSLNAHKRAQALPEVSSGIAYPTAVCNAVIRRVAPVALAVALSLPTCVQAAEQVGNFGASGFIFKDSVEVVAVEDPDGEAF